MVAGGKRSAKTSAAKQRTLPQVASASANVADRASPDQTKPKQPTDTDRLLGVRIAALRKAKGLSQSAMGQAVGVTFQQVQKYENGRNRIGAGRLREIARLLEVSVSTFYADESDEGGFGADLIALMEVSGAIELVRSFASIPNDQQRRAIVALVQSVSRPKD